METHGDASPVEQPHLKSTQQAIQRFNAEVNKSRHLTSGQRLKVVKKGDIEYLEFTKQSLWEKIFGSNGSYELEDIATFLKNLQPTNEISEHELAETKKKLTDKINTYNDKLQEYQKSFLGKIFPTSKSSITSLSNVS